MYFCLTILILVYTWPHILTTNRVKNPMKLMDLRGYLLIVMGLINETFAVFYESSPKRDRNLIIYY